MRLGIPYAKWDDTLTYRICPVCGKHLTEESDEFGEQTTNNYGEHYAAEHEADEEES